MNMYLISLFQRFFLVEKGIVYYAKSPSDVSSVNSIYWQAFCTQVFCVFILFIHYIIHYLLASFLKNFFLCIFDLFNDLFLYMSCRYKRGSIMELLIQGWQWFHSKILVGLTLMLKTLCTI